MNCYHLGVTEQPHRRVSSQVVTEDFLGAPLGQGEYESKRGWNGLKSGGRGYPGISVDYGTFHVQSRRHEIIRGAVALENLQ
jgi:hypothetical protein